MARLFAGFSIEMEKQFSVPAANFNGFYLNYRNGRKVEFEWRPISGALFDVNYDIYRDGEKLASFPAGATGKGEAGDSWQIYARNTGTFQNYTDVTAFPGKTHVYRIVARLFDGFSIAMEKQFPVPAVNIGSVYLDYRNGRWVNLGWNQIRGEFFNVNYDIYRDGEKLATFPAGVTGKGEAGDSWGLIGSTWSAPQSYVAAAFPGRPNQYRVVARLFDGFAIEQEAPRVAIPAPSAPRYIKAEATGNAATRLSWSNDRNFSSEAKIQVQRDGVLIATLNSSASWVFPSYYDDTTADHLNQDHVYRLRTEYFPGCVSDWSPAATAVFPQSQPVITAIADAGQIRLNWTSGAVFGNPCLYKIYRDGVRVGETASTSFVDANLPAGELHHYAVNAILPGRRQSGFANAVSVHTRLPAGSVAQLISPRASLVSPA